jgi:hypothetical protein
VDPEILGKRDKLKTDQEKVQESKASSDTPGKQHDTSDTDKPTAKKKLVLNSGDSIYAEIRALHFRTLGPILHNKAQSIAATYKERHTALTVSEMHTFMQKFKTAHTEHTSLQTHINIAERLSTWTKTHDFDKRIDIEKMIISNTIDDMTIIDDYLDAIITRRVSINHVLRLLVLLSLTEQLRQRRYDDIKRNIIGSYGYQSMYVLLNLEKHGLLGLTNKRRNFSALARELKLFVNNVNVQQPTDIAYLFNGYAPMSVRLLQYASQRGWQQMNDIFQLIPGGGRTFDIQRDVNPTVEIPVASPAVHPTANTATTSTTPVSTTSTASTAATTALSPKLASQQQRPVQPSTSLSSLKSSHSASNLSTATGASASTGTIARRKKTTLVYFVGGVTTSEIAALRFLSQKPVSEHDRTYIIATTKLINANHILDAYQQLRT